MILKYIYIFLIAISFSGCSGCSKSGRMNHHGRSNLPEQQNDEPKRTFSGKTVVKMQKESGVYKIPVKVNGVDMDFIFDTGAGLISISNVEASYLYKQGKLTSEDIIGQGNFSDANGDISVGTIIMLKEISLGDRKLYNVEASVVNNTKAPLLFGQSALEKFGKVSIDYNNSTITFE